ncbi:MAG TPA: sugar phosphate isomerase/epimerase [Candidatus Methanoperedenaceae archaeon]|nr:sugar phosphate isomerase/epimerase [Candidatus Methanoperedenaceae archaeon]
MIIGASSFASPLPELQREVDSIELYMPKLGLYKGTSLVRERLEELSDTLSTGNFPTSMHAPYFGDSPNYPPELMIDTAHMSRTQMRLMEECIELAGRFGSKVIVVHPGKITGTGAGDQAEVRECCFNSMVGNLKKLACTAAEHDVMLGLENKEGTDPTNLCCSSLELKRAIEAVDSPSLGATFDIGHANLTCGGDMRLMRNFARELCDSVVHLHVHDNKGTPEGRYFGDLHGAPGEGCIDFNVLSELRYSGIYNLEVFTLEGIRKGKRVLGSLDNNHS